MPIVKRNRKLLIVAPARSGTLYISKVFCRAGLNLPHEVVGTHGTVSHYFILPKIGRLPFSKKQLAARASSVMGRENYKFETIWLQLRDPLRTIDSLSKSMNTNFRRWSIDNFGLEFPTSEEAKKKIKPSVKSRLEWALNYWLKAYIKSREISDRTYRVEDLEKIWEDLSEKLELDCSLPRVSTKCHQGMRFAFKSKPEIAQLKSEMYNTSWETLSQFSACEKVQKIADSQGYLNE